MNTALMQEIEALENVVTECFGRPEGDDLPQVASVEDIIATVSDTIQ